MSLGQAPNAQAIPGGNCRQLACTFLPGLVAPQFLETTPGIGAQISSSIQDTVAICGLRKGFGILEDASAGIVREVFPPVK